MNTAASSLRDALLDDGRFVLQMVVTKLYRGNNQRPDIFFKSNEKLCQKNYNSIFSFAQRQMIQNSGSPNAYNIESASEGFDVSLLALLAEHTCGLSPSDPLLKKVFEVKNKRNDACHNTGNQLITSSVLNELLDRLLDLYMDILDKLEERSYSDLSFEKLEIKRRIQQRRKVIQDDNRSSLVSPKFYSMPQEECETTLCVRTLSHSDSDDDSYSMPAWSASRQYPTTARSSNSEIPTWGKVALGVTAGIAALGLAGVVAEAATDRKQSGEKKRKEEECAVM